MVSEKEIFSYLKNIGINKSDVVQWSCTFQNEIIGFDIEVKLKQGRYLHFNESTIAHYLKYRKIIQQYNSGKITKKELKKEKNDNKKKNK